MDWKDVIMKMSGLNEDLLVEAHGSFKTASCIACRTLKDESIVKCEILSGNVPKCLKCNNLVKPDITFFGELLPERFGILSQNDTLETDFLLVIGTSLAVYPFANIAEIVPENVPRLLINRESVGCIGSRTNDFLMCGDIIEKISLLCEEMGWSYELDQLSS
uniref:Deacetylase sirtuin-type domain-containing protein n=1 Tax=Clastoptera arizonana TaxID=38151 RepID=A0A1B6E6K2_9HEMI